MVTSVLSLKLFPQDTETFEGYQDAFRELVYQIVAREPVEGLLPDFKGFTKSYNRANWFQPIYGAALARKPLSVRIPNGVKLNLHFMQNWQDKLRQAWHALLVSRKNSNTTAPTPVKLTTAVIPLTAGETQIWKEYLAAGSVKCHFTPWNPFSEAEQQKCIKEVNGWFYKKDTGFLTNPSAMARDFEEVEKTLNVRVRNMNIHMKNAERAHVMEEPDMMPYYEEEMVECIAMIRLYSQVYREMGGDPTEQIKTINVGDQYKRLWGFYG